MDIVILEESTENAGVFENLKGKASFLLTDAKASFDRLQFSSVIIIVIIIIIVITIRFTICLYNLVAHAKGFYFKNIKELDLEI